MTKPTCSVDGCELQGTKRKMCEVHYRRFMRHGSPEASRPPAQMERAAKVVELYAAGAPLEEIAAATGADFGTINYYARRAGLPRRRQKKSEAKPGGRKTLCDDQLSIFFAPTGQDESGRLQRRRQRRVQDNERVRAVEKTRLARPDVQLRTADQQARYRRSPAGRYNNFVQRTKRKKVVNELSREQWLEITANPCVYCGSHCFEGTKTGYGVDRVDCTKGYTLENSVPCCARCNVMKYRLHVDDFLKHVQQIVAYQAKKAQAA